MPTTTWIATTLGFLTAPQTGTNWLALTLWAASEGLPAWYHNWLATFLETTGWQPARTGFTPPYYPSRQDGIDATVLTIKQSNMAGILAALRAGNDLGAIWRAINQSTWCRGCQTGKYPVQLYDQVVASQVPTPTGGAIPPVARAPGITATPAGQLVYDLFATLTRWVQTIVEPIYATMLYIESASAALNE